VFLRSPHTAHRSPAAPVPLSSPSERGALLTRPRIPIEALLRLSYLALPATACSLLASLIFKSRASNFTSRSMARPLHRHALPAADSCYIGSGCTTAASYARGSALPEEAGRSRDLGVKPVDIGGVARQGFGLQSRARYVMRWEDPNDTRRGTDKLRTKPGTHGRGRFDLCDVRK
jgi:hypothetical protein